MILAGRLFGSAVAFENNQRNSIVPRGGKRTGAGRKQGALTKRTRKIAEQAATEGKTPLEVMLANMRHFYKIAESAEAALTELSADKIAALKPAEQFQFLLAEVKKAAGLRELAQTCARDAANYLHPRLTAISAPDGGPVRFERIERVIVGSASHSDRDGFPTTS